MQNVEISTVSVLINEKAKRTFKETDVPYVVTSIIRGDLSRTNAGLWWSIAQGKRSDKCFSDDI